VKNKKYYNVGTVPRRVWRYQREAIRS